MLDDNGLPLDLPTVAAGHLAAAVAAWDDEARAAGLVAAALAAAPDSLGVRLGAYKFYLYRHRLDEAVTQAAAIVAQAARRLQLPADWRDLRPDFADFADGAPWTRLLLQALVALGYGLARTGHAEDAVRVLAKVVDLDPADPFGAGRLLALVRDGAAADED